MARVEKRPVILIRREAFADCPGMLIKVMVREDEKPHPLNPHNGDCLRDWDGEWPAKTRGKSIDGLAVQFWVSEHTSPGETTTTGLRVMDVYAIKEREIPGYAKAFAAYRKLIQKREAERVHLAPSDFVMALGQSLGATECCEMVGNPGRFLPDSTWRFVPLADGAKNADWHYSEMRREAAEKFNKAAI